MHAISCKYMDVQGRKHRTHRTYIMHWMRAGHMARMQDGTRQQRKWVQRQQAKIQHGGGMREGQTMQRLEVLTRAMCRQWQLNMKHVGYSLKVGPEIKHEVGSCGRNQWENMTFDHMLKRLETRKWVMVVTHHHILVTRLSGQQLLYSRGNGDVFPHIILSGA